jgi:hypothetical protein
VTYSLLCDGCGECHVQCGGGSKANGGVYGGSAVWQSASRSCSNMSMVSKTNLGVTVVTSAAEQSIVPPRVEYRPVVCCKAL